MAVYGGAQSYKAFLDSDRKMAACAAIMELYNAEIMESESIVLTRGLLNGIQTDTAALTSSRAKSKIDDRSRFDSF